MLLRSTLAWTLAATTIAACSSDRQPAADTPASALFSGAVMTPARAKPDFTFTRIDGSPYDFRAQTGGKLTYLFFGYTHCPDVCPLHMANLAAVYQKLPYSDRQNIRVIFVTTDPERDTPDRLRTWLANFSPDFIGVAGDMDQINGLQQSMGMPPAVQEAAPTGSAAGAYGVAHGAAVLTFTPDDSLRVLYPFGTRQQDFARDVPRLLQTTAR
jgi:protein SCO1